MLPNIHVDLKRLRCDRVRKRDVKPISRNHISITLRSVRRHSLLDTLSRDFPIRDLTFDLPDKPLLIKKITPSEGCVGSAIYQENGSPGDYELVAFVKKLPHGVRKVYTSADVVGEWREASNYQGE